MFTDDRPVETKSESCVPVADVIGLPVPQPIPSPVPQPARLRGLDGLRAVAVGAVLLFHADIPWARGGYLGVDLFFVISGFLITGLLAGQCQRQSAGLLWPFYWRRAKRLLPAVWLMIAGVVAAAGLIAADALPRLRADALASFLYVTNWEFIWRDTSYFETIGRQPLLKHLWSLAIEEQFYLVWAPLVLWGLPRLGRGRMAIVTLALALASAAWMAVTAMEIGYPGQADPSRLYFGTDTHGFPLLLGAALGLLWQPNRQPAVAAKRAWPFPVGLAALAGMLALFALLGEETPWLYPWGLLVSALASIVLIAAATHSASAFGLWLDNRVMRWIGERSYGIYLWHWPVFMLTRPGIDLPMLPPAVVMLVRIVLVIGIAALSYTYVESPIRQGALEHIWRNLRAPRRRRRRSAWRHGLALLAGISITFSAVAAVLLRAPDHTVPAADVSAVLDAGAETVSVDVPDAAIKPEVVSVDAPVIAPVDIPVLPSRLATISIPRTAPMDTHLDTPVEIPPAKPEPPDQPIAAGYTGSELTAVGDSVLLGSSHLLAITLKGVDIHATVGWQAADMLNQFKALSQGRQLRPVVLVHLGTNGYIAENQLRKILSMLADAKRVILVNTHVPRRWMDVNNALIDQVAADYPNVVVADWRGVSDGHPDYFVSDGVHLNVAGQRAFIAEIMRTGHLVPAADTKTTGAAKRNVAYNPAPPAGIQWKWMAARHDYSLACEDMTIARLSPACSMTRPVLAFLKPPHRSLVLLAGSSPP